MKRLIFIALLLTACNGHYQTTVTLEVTYQNGDREILTTKQFDNIRNVYLSNGCIHNIKDTRCYVRGFKIIK